MRQDKNLEPKESFNYNKLEQGWIMNCENKKDRAEKNKTQAMGRCRQENMMQKKQTKERQSMAGKAMSWIKQETRNTGYGKIRQEQGKARQQNSQPEQ